MMNYKEVVHPYEVVKVDNFMVINYSVEMLRVLLLEKTKAGAVIIVGWYIWNRK